MVEKNTKTIKNLLAEAKSRTLAGDRQTAIELYNSVLMLKPRETTASSRLKKLEIEASCQFRVKAKPEEPDERVLRVIQSAFVNKPVDEAVNYIRDRLREYPRSLTVLSMLSVAFYANKQPYEAVSSYELAISWKPECADFYRSAGEIYREFGFLEKTETLWRRALWLRFDESLSKALIECQENIKLIPAQYRLQAERIDAKKYKAILESRRTQAETAVSNSDPSAMIGAVDLAARFPEVPDCISLLGKSLLINQQYSRAIKYFEKSTSLDPRQSDALTNLGIAYLHSHRHSEALIAFNKALALDPKSASAWYNRGSAQAELGQFGESFQSTKRAIRYADGWVKSLAQASLLFQTHRVCAWSESHDLRPLIETLGISHPTDLPITFLSLEDHPLRQLQRAEGYVERNFKKKYQYPQLQRVINRPNRLKLGYFSADFHNFPGMHLMIGMLENHDRERFEIFAFSYGRKIEDEMRSRIVKAVDHFVDVESLTNEEIVKLARELQIDIAFHRNGYTREHRSGIFSMRAAPIQINYLGYPGTLGADFIDYIVADEILVPPEFKNCYFEKIIYMPDTYQPNDNLREISSSVMSKEECGLPEDSFVLCCFNQIHKITPDCFEIWMRILKRRKNTVLWLISDNSWTINNIRREAKARGVNPDRLHFAERVSVSTHLARHKHIDLCIDTFNYNAHTTTSDALWTSTPIVTKQGDQFAARVASSLLHSINAPELVTFNDSQYEALILELIDNSEKLAAIKRKLEENRMTAPLFDTIRYTRNFEKAMDLAYENYMRGEQPKDIHL